MGYLNLIKKSPKQICFGFLHTLGSGLGQSYFFSLFVAGICAEYSLTKSSYGSYYALATLGSAVLFSYTGALIDRISIRTYSISVILLLTISCIAGGLSNNLYAFIISLFFLRHAGQGLMPHITNTTIATSFFETRGKALSLANLGYAVSEALLPFIFIALSTSLSWQETYLAFGVFALALLPASLYFSTDVMDSKEKMYSSKSERSAKQREARKKLFTSPYFYLTTPCALVAPALMTGLIFYQLSIAPYKGWSENHVIGSFASFAIFRLVSSFISGAMIDRFSAKKLMPIYLGPMALACFILIKSETIVMLSVFWALCGITVGFGSNIKSAVWAEVYGTDFYGTIKSIFGPLTVFSTAITPPVFGAVLDVTHSFDNLLWLGIFIAVSTSFISFLGLKKAQV